MRPSADLPYPQVAGAKHGGRKSPPRRPSREGTTAAAGGASGSSAALDHLTVTVAPAPSSASLALSAAALSTPSRIGFGAASTRSLASFRPREVSARTSLMTLIFLSPAASRTTSNWSCSAAASSPPAAAPPAAGAAATATGAAAVTPKVSSNCFTNSESSISVISLNASSSSSVLSFAMVAVPSGWWPAAYAGSLGFSGGGQPWSGFVGRLCGLGGLRGGGLVGARLVGGLLRGLLGSVLLGRGSGLLCGGLRRHSAG